MAPSTPLLLAVVRTVALVVAGWITVTSYRAYRRTGQPTFRDTTAGFALLGVGLTVESVLIGTVPLSIVEIHTLESAVFAVGFLVLYRSLAGTG